MIIVQQSYNVRLIERKELVVKFMDATTFQQHVTGDEDLRSLAIEVAQVLPAADGAKGAAQRYVTLDPADPFLALSAYILYRYVKDTLDYRRAVNETEIAAQRIRLIARLVDEGFPQEKAQEAVTALLTTIAKRTEDDPALSKARALLGGKEK